MEAMKITLEHLRRFGLKRPIPWMPVSKRALNLSERPALLRQEFPPICRKTFPRLHRSESASPRRPVDQRQAGATRKEARC
jgi:hypothetical protein